MTNNSSFFSFSYILKKFYFQFFNFRFFFCFVWKNRETFDFHEKSLPLIIVADIIFEKKKVWKKERKIKN